MTFLVPSKIIRATGFFVETRDAHTELAVCRVPGQDDHGQHPYEQGVLEDQTGQSTKSERNSCVQQFILNTG